MSSWFTATIWSSTGSSSGALPDGPHAARRARMAEECRIDPSQSKQETRQRIEPPKRQIHQPKMGFGVLAVPLAPELAAQGRVIFADREPQEIGHEGVVDPLV